MISKFASPAAIEIARQIVANSMARLANGPPRAAAEGDRVPPLVPGPSTVTRSATSGLLEISASGVTKATGLARHCENLRIPREHVVAVGDMPNDIPMLEWAGRSYAVANAHPAAQEAADEVLAQSKKEVSCA